MSEGKSDNTARPPSIDEPRFYYQNPKTGAVSSSTLSIRQLCKLLIPVREGLPTILTPQTMMIDTTNEKQEWRAANAIPILKEAASMWYHHSKDSPSKDAVSCRTIATLVGAADADDGDGDNKASSLLVFSQGITPEWIAVSKLPNLLIVLEALKQPTMQETVDREENAKSTKSSGAKEETTKQPNADDDDGDANVQSELEQFLTMTNDDGDGDGQGDDHKASGDNDDGNDLASYQSDGGTRYIQDPTTGNWLHEAVAALHKQNAEEEMDANKNSGSKKKSGNDSSKDAVIGAEGKKKKKHKKAQFAKKNAKCWIYVTGLPEDGVTVQDVSKYFGKAGLIDLDPETLQPKVKLYKDRATGKLKGDASICYARPDSVTLALQVLDQSPWDANHTLTVQRAHFEAKKNSDKQKKSTSDDNQRGESDHAGNKRRKRPVSEAQRKVARLALLQAQDDGFGGRLAGGRKGLRIVVVQNMVNGLDEDKWEAMIHEKCDKDCGPVEKITVLSKNNNVVIIKFVEPTAASEAVQHWDQAPNLSGKSKMTCKYWDGVTDYTNSHENEESRADEEKRHEDFGNWLEDQELPPELRLQVEGGK